MKRIIFIVTVLILLLIIVNLSISLATLWSKKDVLTAARQRLLNEQKEHGRLQKELQRVSDPLFVEQEARDKLFLGKPGDSIVFFPKASASAQKAALARKTPLQEWWELFLH